MNQNKNKLLYQLKYWLGVAIIGVMVGVSVQFVIAWTEPTASPPGGNLGAPLNISGANQFKRGMLYLNAAGSNFIGLSVRNSMIVRNTGNAMTSIYVGDPYSRGNSNDGRIVLYGEHNGNIYTGTITQGSSNMFINTHGNVMFSSPVDVLSGNYLRIRNSNNQRWGVIRHSGSNLLIYPNSGNTVFTQGNVGIGTGSPSKKLDVNGDIKGNRLCIGNDCRDKWPISDTGHGTLVKTIRYSSTFTITEGNNDSAHGNSGYVYCHSNEILVGCVIYGVEGGWIMTDRGIDSNDAYYYDKYTYPIDKGWSRSYRRSVMMTPDQRGCYTSWCEDDPRHRFNAYHYRTGAICLRIQ